MHEIGQLSDNIIQMPRFLKILLPKERGEREVSEDVLPERRRKDRQPAERGWARRLRPGSARGKPSERREFLSRTRAQNRFLNQMPGSALAPKASCFFHTIPNAQSRTGDSRMDFAQLVLNGEDKQANSL